MSNFNYKNIKEINRTNTPVFGQTIATEQLSLLEKAAVIPQLDVNDSSFRQELHVFLSNLVYQKSEHNVKTGYLLETFGERKAPEFALDVHSDIRNLLLPANTYKVVYNFHKDYIGSFDSKDKLFISEISEDRTEIKLSLTNPDSSDGKTKLASFVLENLKPKKYVPPIILNFGSNVIFDIINITSVGDPTSFYAKLYEPLANDIDIYTYCWVSVRLLQPYIDTVTYVAEQIQVEPNFISGPNFEVDYDYWVVSETNYKSWSEILSENIQTSEQILSRYISSSASPVTLNIDYGEFRNFIYYSNAEERVDNFIFKMGLLENYRTELAILQNYSASVTSPNLIKVRRLRDTLINGFDGFEKYLYQSSTGSINYTYQISSSIKPFPKIELDVTASNFDLVTKEGKFNFQSISSSIVLDWGNDLLEQAREYDAKNYNALVKAVPDFISEDVDNSAAISFVNMLGQHFDVLYLYTDHILKKNLRRENPKDGASQDLVYEITRNMGWTLTHGTSAKDLWEYALGVSGSGDPIWTGKTSVRRDLSKTYEERTKEVWRRILNNLPYIYKTKGTARGIRALLAAYGIPQTLLSIREFGGPDNADLGIIPRTEWEKHTYYFNFFGSLPTPTTNRYIYVPWEEVTTVNNTNQYPDTVTFRWKMEPEFAYKYTGNSTQTLLQKESGGSVGWFVTMDKNSGTDVGKGSVAFWLGDGTNYTSASIYDDYFYDDVPLNLMIRREYSTDNTSSNQIYSFFVKTGKYGKLVIERSGSIIVSGSDSGSYNQSWASNGTLYIGSGSNIQTDNILSGSVYELRYWVNQLKESSFNNHVLAPRAYNGNTPTSSFYELQAQWKFWQPFDVAATSSLISSHPDQTKSSFATSPKVATFYNFTSESFESITETYNMEVATVGNNTPFSQKVRNDSGSLLGGLSKDQSVVVSRFDKFSVDSNKLMIAFSPQSVINEDIYEAIGYTTIDDYFGEYSNINKEEYPRLKQFSREYWQKYPNKNDFTAYINLISIFDFSVFDQIRQMIPARVNEILGIVIEPNVLERSKVRAIRGISGDSPEKTVRRTNEISSSGTPFASVSSNKSTIMIGFENESSYQELETEIENPLEFEASTDLNVAGDFDPIITPIGYAKQYRMTISSSRGNFANFKKEIFKPHRAIIQVNTGSFISEYTQYFTSIARANFGRVLGSISSGMGTGFSNVFAIFDTKFSETETRTNVEYSPSSPDVGYGTNWKPISSDTGKALALFTTYQTYRTDSYYSGYKFYYTSSRDIAHRTYSSFEYVTGSSFENPNSLTNSIRNHRFEGSKLTGPDINVDTRSTPDGKPVIELFIVDPNQININQYSGNSGI
jgi:hypothetical protein